MIKRFKILLVLVSVSLTLCLMSNTYSRYVANTTGNLEAAVAKWQILINNNDITNNATSSIELTPTLEDNPNVAKNKIAPSSKGYFDIDIDLTNVDVSVNYFIDLELINQNMPDLLISKYSVLDETYIEGDEIENHNLQENRIAGTLNFDKETTNFKYKPFTIRIYFEWYEGANETMDDDMDTQLASIENETLKIKANINFEQKLV